MTYDYTLDFRSANNSHMQLLQRVPPGANVLEFGCATGYMSAYLQEQRGCRVVGVDIDAVALEKAAAHCTRTLCLDVESADWRQALGEDRYDVILCADIIEHLKNPAAFLRQLPPLLSEGGRLLASVPNGAHVSIRLELLSGQLTYEDAGLLDRTHLHLFTHQSLMALLTECGFAVDELAYTFHDIPDDVIRRRLAQLDLEPGATTLARLHAPDAVAYQYVLSCRPLKEDEVPPSWPELSDKPLRQSEEVYSVVNARLHEAQQLAKDRHEVILAKEAQLKTKDAQLKAKEAQLKERDGRLELKERRVAELSAQRAEHASRLQHYERQLASKDGRIGELSHLARLLDIRVSTLREDRLRDQAVVRGQRGRLRKAQQQLSALRRQHRELARRHAALSELLNTRSWRVFRALTLPARGVARLGPYASYLVRHPGVAPQWMAKALRLWRQGGIKGLRWHLASAAAGRAAPRPPAYRRWIAQIEQPREPGADEIRDFVAALEAPPRVSIVMPVFEPRPDWLRAAIESVIAQSYSHWQLCIADDASPSEAVRDLLREYQQRDERINVLFREVNGHISVATNSALAMAEGDWVGFLDHDDLLSPHALYHVIREIQAHPEAQLLYSDEDKLDERGQRFAHYFKPDFNPDLMLSHNLVCHFSVYRRELVDRLGGLREGFEGAQDYDLALRCVGAVEPTQIRHIPRILYHWRAVPGSTAAGVAEKPYAMAAATRAVQEYLQARGVAAEVTPSTLINGMLRVRYPIPDPAPLVSLIIPTRNGLRLLRQCVDSIREKVTYPNVEIVIVDNQSDDRDTKAYLAALAGAGQARVLAYDKPFNFAAINNYAVSQAKGAFLCFLNNDIEAIDGEWLAEMVGHAARPEIGAVGARLLYPDGRLQHGGVVTGLGGVAGHAMKYLSGEAKGYNARAVLIQNYSAVTAACMVVRRDVFEQVGGFDAENLGVAFNDVDLCLRIREQGYRNLWTPYAELYHHESATRGAEDTDEKQARFGKEIAYMKSRWGEGLLRDPAYNPNLTLDREDFSLNWYGQA